MYVVVIHIVDTFLAITISPPPLSQSSDAEVCRGQVARRVACGQWEIAWQWAGPVAFFFHGKQQRVPTHPKKGT